MHEFRQQIEQQVWHPVLQELRQQFEHHLRWQVGEPVWQKVMNCVRDQNRDHLWENLQLFDFSKAYKHGHLVESLRTAIDYIFMSNQLYTIAFWNYRKNSKVIGEIIRVIEKNTLENEAHNILSSIEVPEGHEAGLLVKIQLEMLKKHLIYNILQ